MKGFIIIITSLVLFGCGSTDKHKVEHSEPKTAVEQIEVKELYPSGVTKIEGLNVDGNREGLWKAYFENGYKWSEVEYEKGIKNGLVVVFYQNGMMRYQGRYYDDARAGLWTFYDTLGVVIKKVDMDESRIESDSLLIP